MNILNHLFRSDKAHLNYNRIYDEIIEAWPIRPDSRFLDTSSGKTHCLAFEESDGPPLVMLHGGNSSSVIWRDLIPKLCRQNKIYCLDIVGDYGKSVPKIKMKTIHHLLNWLRESLDALGLEKAHVLGFSYGGWITLNFAKEYPQRVKKAVLLAPAASFYSLRPSFLIRAVYSMIRPTESVLTGFYQFASEKSLLGNSDYEKKMADLVRLVLAGRQMRSQFVNPSVFKDSELRSIEVPISLMIGENEVIYNPKKSLERAEALIPNIETHLLLKASHDMVFSQSDVVSDKVNAFLK